MMKCNGKDKQQSMPTNKPLSHLDNDKDLEAVLPRTHCPPSCDGNGTYAEGDENGEPTPAQCQWCYEVVMPLREAIDQYTQSKLKAFAGEVEKSIGKDKGYQLKHHPSKDVINIQVSAENKLKAELRESLKAIKEKAGIE